MEWIKVVIFHLQKKANIEDDIVLRDIGADQITDGDDCQQKTDCMEDGSKSQSENAKTKWCSIEELGYTE